MIPLRLLFKKKKGSYVVFYRLLGFLPRKISYYEEALRHKSLSGGSKRGHFDHNERLEFLGDAILNAIISDLLFQQYKTMEEGFLTNTRSKVVQRESLDYIANELNLNQLIMTSVKIQSPKTHILGNALEALIGAIYLDKGYYFTRSFIEKKIINQYIDIDTLAKKEINFKSRLLEWCQKYKVSLEYELLESCFNEQNQPTFRSKVIVNGLVVGTGFGFSKKESQQNASKMALKKLTSDKKFAEQVLIRQTEEDIH